MYFFTKLVGMGIHWLKHIGLQEVVFDAYSLYLKSSLAF